MKKENADFITENVTTLILESISDGVFTINNSWRITSFNRAAELITGISRDEAIGRHCWEVFRSNMCEADCALRKTMAEGRAFVDSAGYIVNSEMREIPIVVCTSVLTDSQGKMLGGVETFRDNSQVEELRRKLNDRFQAEEIISRSPAMEEIIRNLPETAESDSSVLIQGETGTGKELLARAIHRMSHRHRKPFVAINCGALPDSLLESELFGYRAGAFTHAVKDKPGLFAMAEGGTLFLDEIGDISQGFQVRLLRVLQEKSYQPLGGTKSLKTDVRIVTASNKNIETQVADGSFRMDLFYRINVVKMTLPPLRERLEDIGLLVNHFIRHFNLLQGKSITGISSDAMKQIMEHPFQGNIRELENMIEHAFIHRRQGDIQPTDLPQTFEAESQDAEVKRSDTSKTRLKRVEVGVIEEALRRNGYNRLAAARDLGIHKSTLFRKIKSLGIRLPDIDGRTKPLKP
jgi:PAS domain S-box-containing protein